MAGWNTWILPLEGERKAWLWDKAGTNVTTPAFSPDGRWLAYQSMESGKMEIYVRPFPGPGEKVRVSGKDGGLAPVWLPGGRAILYLPASGDTRILEARLEVGRTLRPVETHVAFALPFPLTPAVIFQSRLIAVTSDGRRIIAVQPDEQKPPETGDLKVIVSWAEQVRAAVRQQ